MGWVSFVNVVSIYYPIIHFFVLYLLVCCVKTAAMLYIIYMSKYYLAFGVC